MEPDNDQNSVNLTLADYLDILRQRRMIVLQAFIVIALAGTVITLMTRPVYKATARLLVEPPSTDVNTVDSSNPLSQILTLTPTQTVATQVEVLQSAPLVQKVLTAVGTSDTTIDVEQVKDTAIIEVSAEANSRDVSAAVANLLLEDYIQQDLDQGLAEIRAAKKFATRQDAEAHARLKRIDRQILDFKTHNKVDDLAVDHTMWSQRTQDLEKEVQSNQASLAAAQAQLNHMQSDFAKSPSVIMTTLPSTNPARAELKDEILKLRADRISMTQKGGFTRAAPQVVAVDARLSELGRQLASQPALLSTQAASLNPAHEALRTKIVDANEDIAANRAQTASLRAQLVAANAHISRFASWEAAYDSLIRARDSTQAADTMFIDKITDLDLREQAHHATAHIIERAQVPAVPIKPMKIPSILFSCVIGLFAGLCLALLQDFLDDRINSPEEVIRLLKLPSLGHIPVWDAGHGRLLSQMNTLGPAAESYRLLRTNIHFASVDTPTRTLLVTSSNPGEGKTTTAANLACAMALDGKRVIIVDTDLRRPSIHKMFNVLAVPGLTDVILGHASLLETLLPYDALPNLSILPAGSIPPNPSEVLNSRTFSAVVSELVSRADVVIFDSPPVLVAADAAILASQMDGAILVVENGSTKKGSALRALQVLQQARANVMGISYNKMATQTGSYYYYNYNYSYHALDGDHPKQSIPERVILANGNHIDVEPNGHARTLESSGIGKEDQ